MPARYRPLGDTATSTTPLRSNRSSSVRGPGLAASVTTLPATDSRQAMSDFPQRRASPPSIRAPPGRHSTGSRATVRGVASVRADGLHQGDASDLEAAAKITDVLGHPVGCRGGISLADRADHLLLRVGDARAGLG